MMKRMSLLFIARKAKMTRNKLVPLYVRVTLGDEGSFEISVKRSVDPLLWNAVAQKLDGKTEDIKSFNAYLKAIETQINYTFDLMLREKLEITPASLKRRLTEKDEEPKHKKNAKTLVPIFEEHNQKIEALVGTDYSKETCERYKTSLRHTISFMQFKYGIDDIDIENIDLEFINAYDFYLRTEKKCANNSAVKYIKNFGKIIRICLAHGWIARDPFANYKMKVKEVRREFLTEEEIERIKVKEFTSERLKQVRDIFLFSCYTGLAYADVQKLRRTEVVKHFDGEEWILTTRQKTKSETRVPLLVPAREILDAYAAHPQCKIKGLLLPVPSNQKMNEYLKEIAERCDINKPLTFHIARHTFATTVTLSNGVPIESVSKMLGHKNLRTTQHYAKILDTKVSNDMAALRRVMEFKNISQKNQ
jgi:site-specific recombinase XerD